MTTSTRTARWCAITPLESGLEGQTWVIIAAVHVTAFAAIMELLAIVIGSEDETEALDAPGLAATPHTRTQLLYFTFSTLFVHCTTLLPLLVILLLRKVAPAVSRVFNRDNSNARRHMFRLVDAIVLVLTAFALAFPAVWVAADRDSTQYFARIEARDSEVLATFNDYYCRARSTQLCANEDPSHLATLAALFGGGGGSNSTATVTANVNSGADHTPNMTNVFRVCQYLLVSSEGGLSRRQAAFLKSSNTSDAADVWCGRSIAESVLGGGELLSSIPIDDGASTDTPSSINGAKFEHFVGAWKSRLSTELEFLSLIALLVLVLSWTWLKIPVAFKRFAPTAQEEIKYALASRSLE